MANGRVSPVYQIEYLEKGNVKQHIFYYNIPRVFKVESFLGGRGQN